MYYTIYKITNQINGKIYIGSHKTKDLDDGYMGSGKYLKYAQDKHGIDNFFKEILFVFDTSEEMYAKEAELVNEDFIAEANTYNIKVGGFGGFDYINSKGFTRNSSHFDKHNIESSLGGVQSFRSGVGIHTEESHQKAKQALQEKYPQGTFYGKNHSDESKLAIGKKNSTRQSGSGNSQAGTIWITNGTESVKIKKEYPIPPGWARGRIVKNK